MRYLFVLATLLAIAVVAGCASNPPALRTESSTSAIRAAEEVGASGVPRAALHLQYAREELAQAERLSAKGDKDEAASQLLRAEADAELALVLSKEDVEKSAAATAVERVALLQRNNR